MTILTYDVPKPIKRALGAVCTGALFVLSAAGTLRHVIDVRALVDSSDLIACGQIISASDRGVPAMGNNGAPSPGNVGTAILLVDEILKGGLETATVQFEFIVPGAPSGIQGISPGQYGVFFLQKASSAYQVVDPAYAFLPALPHLPSSQGDPIDRVVAKLTDVVTRGRPDRERSAALDALATIEGQSSTNALRSALHITSGDVQLRVGAKLVARNDITGLAVVADALLSPSSVPQYLFPTLAGSLAGLKDSRAIPTLKRLLATKNPSVIKTAAMALRQTKSPDALASLSGLLNDGDEQVRYCAVVGLGEITGQNEWTPSFPEFHDQEAKYLSYWRTWASSNIAKVIR
jgi:hypothetical protein